MQPLCSTQFLAVKINSECPEMQVLYTVGNSIELTTGKCEPVYKVIIVESVT